jgi:hypothetical protein
MVSSQRAPDGELARGAEEGYWCGLPNALMDVTRRIAVKRPSRGLSPRGTRAIVEITDRRRCRSIPT